MRPKLKARATPAALLEKNEIEPKKEAGAKTWQSPLGMTREEHERLEIHETRLNSLQAAERAYLDAVAAAQAADRFAEETASSAQAAAWDLARSKKSFDARKAKMLRETAKEQSNETAKK